MKPWRNKLLLLGGVAALGLAIPAASQDAPVLPPGFGDPANQPPPPPPPPPPPTNVENVEPQPSRPAPRRSRAPASDSVVVTDAEIDLEALAAINLPPPIEIPDEARRPTDVVGWLGPADGGLGDGAFGTANGRFLSTLMRRIDAPLPSRWASILLRRALLSRVQAPSFVHPVDWVAERAWLLLRMGEADAARMLVQSVDVDKFTPKMFAVAVQTALATADPAALCPLVEPGRAISKEPVWPLADSICAALKGDASKASAGIDQARRRGTARGIDLLLAEKVIGAGPNTRRAVTIQWDEVEALNSWRFGLAAATGVEFPERLLQDAPDQMRAWHARAPMIPLEQRVDTAQTAAVLGVFSNDSLVELYSLLMDGLDVTELEGSVGARLRRAYVGRTAEARIDAFEDLWSDAKTPEERYARLLLTAVAASRLPPMEAFQEEAPNLIASMLSAGADREVSRWADLASGLDGEAGERAWALLAVGSPQPVDISSGQIADYRGGDFRAKLLFAALAGLGRIDEGQANRLAERMEVPIGRENAWTRMLDAAVRNRQQGTVAVLAAAGMQTPSWRGVPPEHLYRIIRALTQVGLEYEARMIAAEALTRL
ncbi:MAG TPA: hypothetical protein VGR19_02305 [Allosphingosinicella sp.]|nr:hypothetical protein [Allosphingosinicella sp.]